MPYQNITFLTDYGTVDESVGVVKSVIKGIAPGANVIDLTHDIAPFDVRTAGVVLARSAAYLVPGVVLAVVDPGVGTERRAIAVEVGAGESVLIGPDNGLLAPAVAVVGGATRVFELSNPQYQLSPKGFTFAGRDVFGPAAAHLCVGVAIEDLGLQIDAATLVPATLPFSETKDGVLNGDVIYVDRYGNLHTNVEPDQLDQFGEKMSITLGGRTEVISVARTFGSVAIGAATLLVDEAGMISVAVNQASAADRFGADLGAPITVKPI